MSEILFARQPIVDAHARLRGYELLFRPIGTRSVDHMALSVLTDAFCSLGLGETLGTTRGYVNFERDLFLSEAVEVLPPDRFVIEILETVEADELLVERCKELRKRGYKIALDDYVPGDPRAELLPVVDLVKVDLPAATPGTLSPLVRELRKHPVTLLAEKVETEREFVHCKRLGFDLFQGFYFARPESLSGHRTERGASDLMKTMQLIETRADTDDIADWVKLHPEIATNLLGLVNSSGLGPSQRVTSIAHAITYLGLEDLRRWVWILLFTALDERGTRSPLLWHAAVRGRTLELIAEHLGKSDPRAPDSGAAFTVGLISVAHVLLADSMQELVERLSLEEFAEGALLARKGVLGDVLEAIDGIDSGDVGAAHRHAEAAGVSLREITEMSVRADFWVTEALAGRI